MQLALVIDEHRLARRHVAQQAKTQGVDRHAFRRHDVFVRHDLIVDADHQRADTVRIAERQQAITGDEGRHRIGTLAARMNTRDGAENRIQTEFPPGSAHLQFMRQHVQQHLGIRIGVDVAQVSAEQRFLQFMGIGEVAVVPEDDAIRRVHIERLRFGRRRRAARGGIAHMGHPHVAQQTAHVAGAEHVARQPRPLVQVKAAFLRGHDPGCILPAVLQHHQAVVQELIGCRIGNDSDYPAHAAHLFIKLGLKNLSSFTTEAQRYRENKRLQIDLPSPNRRMIRTGLRSLFVNSVPLCLYG